MAAAGIDSAPNQARVLLRTFANRGGRHEGLALGARLDIVLLRGEEPLAVLELKRSGVPLTREDEERGPSYARMLHPRPPLVIVISGIEIRLIEGRTCARTVHGRRAKAPVPGRRQGGDPGRRDRKRSVTLILQSLATFVVRRSTLRENLEAADIRELLSRGLLRPFQPPSGEALLAIRQSELLASEIDLPLASRAGGLEADFKDERQPNAGASGYPRLDGARAEAARRVQA